VNLGRGNRQQEVHVYSSSDFDVLIRYESDTELDEPRLKYKVTRADANSNDYKLTLIVPSEVQESFDAKIVLQHPLADF